MSSQPQATTIASSGHHAVARRPAFLVQLFACFLVSLALTNVWVGHLSSAGQQHQQHSNKHQKSGSTTLSHHNNDIRRTLIESRVQSLLREKRQAMEKDLEKRIEDKVHELWDKGCLGVDPPPRPMNFESISPIVQGFIATPRHEFLDLGFPHDEVTLARNKAKDNALVCYGRRELLPDSVLKERKKGVYFTQTEIPVLPQDEALKKCNKVMVLPVNEKGSCVALVPHHGEGRHIQHWARVSETLKRPDMYEKYGKGQPLRLVSRTVLTNGIDEFQAPKPKLQREAFDMFQGYFGAFESVKRDFRALLDPSLDKNKDVPRLVPYQNKTIVVMVANYGQSEILANFVCSAHARNLDISSVLVFATDPNSRDWAHSLGLAAIYNEELFKMIPQREARLYGDSTFKFIMTVKIISVQLTLYMGYDVLFQDADIVWHKHPIRDYFWDTERWKTDSSHGTEMVDRYDVIGQEDGSRSLRYAPYYMNSGFYYIRQNERSVAFLNSLLLSLPLMLTNKSHQQAMIEVMSQHVSLHGLKVKVISRQSPELPCGFHFHQQREYMKQVVQGRLTPIIFHMSWTLNKDNKVNFFQQMDEWRVQPQCVGTKAPDVAANVSGAKATGAGNLLSTCCAAKPLFQCHYRDKPSIRPCYDSPPLDKGGPSFWTPEDEKRSLKLNS